MTVPALFKNVPAPGVDEYYPLNEPPIGTPLPKEDYPQNENIPKLFQPLTIRGVKFKNRIWVSPMCLYSAVDGHMTDWHLVHLGAFAIRGAGMIMLESTAVTPEGRITPECPGIWSDSHIAPMKRIVDFIHGQGTTVGIQLAHAGRKASILAPYVFDRRQKAGGEGSESEVARAEEGGWPDDVVGPGDIPFSENLAKPHALTKDGIKRLLNAYIDAVERCKKIGFDFIEIHGAHGYLIHSFYSPISNNRTDEYGGSLENRLRFPLEVIRTVRAIWDRPIFFRISASEYAGPEKNANGDWVSWGIEQSVELARRLKEEGVDLLDVSSGGNYEQQKILPVPGYQLPFAERIKEEIPELLVGAVGLITEPKQAEHVLQRENADAVLFARELLRHIDFPLYAAHELGIAVKPTNQYEMAWSRMLTPTNIHDPLTQRPNLNAVVEAAVPCYPVEAPQEFDEPGKELGPDAQVWKTYIQEADQVNEEMVDGWNRLTDVILIFAALFSAISTAFVIESYKNLKQDPANVSSQTLLTISQTLMLIANGSQPTNTSLASDKAPAFKASAKAVCVNVLWFLSLSLSVAVLLISMLAKEWCLEFMSGRTGPPGAQARRRQQRWDGLVKWRMKEVIVVLPSLIHLSLLLFAIGLCVFLWDVHFGVAIPVAVVTTMAAGAYFACTIVPFFNQKMSRDNQAQDRVTASALRWMIETCKTPRLVDIVLQLLAGAKEGLPPNELEKPEPSRRAMVLYERALEVHPNIRARLDGRDYGTNNQTQWLEQLAVGVQSTINGLIYEVLPSSRPWDQGTRQILMQCTKISQYYLRQRELIQGRGWDCATPHEEVDPANLVGNIANLLEPYLKSRVGLDSISYRTLFASFALAMCCNVALGITQQSENVGHVL